MGIINIIKNYIQDLFKTYPEINQFLQLIVVLRWFDESILALVLPEELAGKAPEYYALINQQTLVQTSPVRGIVINDLLRSYLLELDTDPKIIHLAHTKSADAYKHQLDTHQRQPHEWFTDPLWKALVIEWIYHMAWVNPEQSMDEYLKICAQAFAVLVSNRQEVEFSYDLFNRIDFKSIEPFQIPERVAKIDRLEGQLKNLLEYRDSQSIELLNYFANLKELNNEQHAALYQWIGSTYMRETGQMALALENLERAYQLNPRDYLVNAELASFHSWNGVWWGNLKLASQFARRVIELEPERSTGYVELAGIHQSMADWETAIQLYEKGAQVENQAVDPWLGLSEIYSERNLPKGFTNSEDSCDLELSIQALDKAETLSPGIRYYALIRKGNVYRASWQIQPAQEAFERAMEMNPDRPDADLYLGQLYAQLSRSRQAEECYLSANQKDPQRAECVASLAQLYADRGMLDRSLQVCLTAEQKGIQSISLTRLIHDIAAAKEDWQSMQDGWRKWLVFDPGSAYLAECLQASAYLNIAWQHRSDEEADEFCRLADEKYTSAIKIDPQLAWAHIGLAELAVMKDDPKVIADERQWLLSNADWAMTEAFIQLGKAYQYKGEWETAENYHRKAIQQSPQRLDGWLALIDLFAAQEQVGNFIDTWMQVIQTNPIYTHRAWMEIGDLLRTYADYDGARGAYEKAQEDKPYLASSSLRLGSLARLLGDSELAEAQYNRILGQGVDEEAVALAEISAIQVAKDEDIKAEESARKAIAFDPYTLDGYLALAHVGVQTNKTRIIQEARKRLKEKRPDLHPQIEFELAEAYREMGKMNKAGHYYKSSLQAGEKLHLELAEAYLGMALILVQQQKYDSAEDNFQLALERLPPSGDYDAFLKMGTAYEAAGKPDLAEKNFRQAILIAPTNPIGRLLLASNLRQQGQENDARQEINLVKDSTGTSCFNLGGFYETQNKYQDALACYLEGIKHPENEDLSRLYSAAGSLYGLMDDLVNAEKALRQSILLSANQTDAYMELMELLVDQGRLEQANEIYQQMTQQPGLEFLANMVYGNLLVEKEETDIAISAYQKAILADPNNPQGYFALGQLLEDQERFSEAAKIYTEMASVPELAVSGLLELGALHDAQGNVEGAIQAYQNAVSLNPELMEPYYLLHDIFLRQNLMAEAERVLLQAIAIAPQDFQANLLLARLREETGMFHESIQIYEAMIHTAPDSISLGFVQTRLGSLHLILDENQAARTALEMAVESNPENTEAHYLLGSLYERLDNLKKAEREYLKVINLSPYNGDAYISLGRIYGITNKTHKVAPITKRLKGLPLREDEIFTVNLVIAETYAQAGDQQAAENAFRSLIKEEPDLESTYNHLADWLITWNRTQDAIGVYQLMAEQPVLRSQAFIQLGALFVEVDDLIQAESSYRSAILAAPDEEEPYYELCSFLVEQDRSTDGLRVLDEMAFHSNLAFTANLMKGNLLASLGQFKDGQKVIEKAISLQPDQPIGYIHLARLLRNQNELEQAIQILRKALKAAPNSLEINQEIAQILEEQGKFEDALLLYRQIAEAIPDNHEAAVIYAHMADLLKEDGNIKAAIDAYLQAIQKKPTDDSIAYDLGDAYEKDHQDELAVEAYLKATQINPRHGLAYVALGRLYGKLNQVQNVHIIARRINQLEMDDDERYNAHLVISLAYQEGGFLEWAIEPLNKAIDLDPDIAQAYINLGIIYELQERWSSALLMYHKALERNPEEEAGLRLAVGRCYLNETLLLPPTEDIRKENDRKAEIELKQALELDAELSEAYLWLAQLYEDQERWDEVMEVQQQITSKGPDLASSALLSIASIHRQLGKLDDMKEACRKVLELELPPQDAAYFDLVRRQGLAHFMIGDYESSEKKLNQAMEGNPQDAQACFYLALNLICQDKLNAAENSLQHGINIAKTKADYRYAIEEAEALLLIKSENKNIKHILEQLILGRDQIT